MSGEDDPFREDPGLRTSLMEFLFGVVAPDSDEIRRRARHDAASLPTVDGWAWVEIGPTTQPPIEGSDSGGGPTWTSGLVKGLRLDEADVDAVTGYGGIWRAPQAETRPEAPSFPQWTPMTEDVPSSTFSVVIGTHLVDGRHTVLYAGTGAVARRETHRAERDGLWRSVDGGKTWHRVRALVGTDPRLSVDVRAIVALAGDTLVVGTTRGLYLTRDGGRHFGADAAARDGRPLDDRSIQGITALRLPLPAAGVTRVTYSVLSLGLFQVDVPDSGAPTEVESAPGSGSRWQLRPPDVRQGTRLVAPGDVAFDSRVVNGEEITLMSVGPDQMAYAAMHSLMACVNVPGVHGAPVSLPASALSPPGRDPQTDYDHFVSIDPFWQRPDAPALAWLGTITLSRVQLLRAARTATIRTQVRTVPLTDLHADQQAAAPLPSVATWESGLLSAVLVANDGGVFRTDDAGTVWRSVGGLRAHLVRSIDVMARGDELTVAVGLQDNGSAIGWAHIPTAGTAAGDAPAGPGAWSWTSPSDGDGGTTLLLPAAGTDPAVAFLTANDNVFRARSTGPGAWPARMDEVELLLRGDFSETQASAYAAARGAGGTWDTVYVVQPLSDTTSRISRGASATGPMHLPGAAGAGTAFRTLRSPPDARSIHAIAALPAPGSPIEGPWTALLVGDRAGRVFYTGDATVDRPDWIDVTPPGNTRRIGTITVDPVDPSDVVVAVREPARSVSRYPNGNVWLGRRDERGAFTWRDISGRPDSDGTNIPDVWTTGAVVHHRDGARWILVATYVGVFATRDNGQQWQRLDLARRVMVGARSRHHRMPSAITACLASTQARSRDRLPGFLVLGTYGRGAWVSSQIGPFAALVVEFDGGFGWIHAGTGLRRTLTVRNQGGAPAELRGLVADSAEISLGPDLPTESTPITLDPGGTWSVEVGFRAGAPGIVAGMLTLTTTAIWDTTIRVPLSAERIEEARPACELEPAVAVDFGPLGEGDYPRRAAITATNIGTGPGTFRAVLGEGNAATVELSADPDSPLAPGASHTWWVTVRSMDPATRTTARGVRIEVDGTAVDGLAIRAAARPSALVQTVAEVLHALFGGRA